MNKKKILLLVGGILLAAAVAAGLFFGIRALTNKEAAESQAEPADSGNQTAESGEPAELDPETAAVLAKSVYTVDDISSDDPRFDLVVAECAGQSLTNRQAQIYFFMQYFGFMSQYGAYASYFGLDETQPLSAQPSMTEGLSWEQAFLAAAMDQFHQYAAAAAKAEAEGYELTAEEKEQLESVLSGLEEEAKTYNFESAEAYLQASFGPGVRVEEYEAYLRTYFLAMSYENSLYEGITWNDEDLKAYFEAHAEEYQGVSTDDGPNVNVRHVLFTFSDEDGDGTTSDQEKAAALARAEELLAGFATNPSEDYFAELANENSEDPGSNTNGGLYEGVYPGQMVDTFNDWCFEPTRQPGDTGIVETTYGYHVMYFVGRTEDYYWKTLAEQDYPMSIMNTKIEEIMAATPCSVNYAELILAPVPKDEEPIDENPEIETPQETN